MMDDALKNVMKKKMGAHGITIEISLDGGDQKEKDEMKKQDMAPPMPKKDAAIKGGGQGYDVMGEDDPAGIEEPMGEEDDSEMVNKMIPEREQDGYLMQAYKGEQPRGLKSKAEQLMVAKKVAMKAKGGKA